MNTKWSRRVWAAVGAAALILAATTVASAVGSEAGQVYSGCLNRRTGTLTEVAVGNDPFRPCSRFSDVIHWNERGEPGPSGAQGAAGADGGQGEQGPAGASAYEVWKALPSNESGTVEEFFASLQGPPGDPGQPGEPGLLSCEDEIRIRHAAPSFQLSPGCEPPPGDSTASGSFGIVNSLGELWQLDFELAVAGEGGSTGTMNEVRSGITIEMTVVCGDITGSTARFVTRENSVTPGSWPQGWYQVFKLTDNSPGGIDSAAWEWLGTSVGTACDSPGSLEPAPGGIGYDSTTIVSGDIQILS